MNNRKYPLKVCPLNLPSHYSMADIFCHYADQAWSMLLDSANSQHKDGRYDIMVADPIATVTTKGNVSYVWNRKTNHNQENSNNPLTLVENLLEQIMPSTLVVGGDNVHLPFMVGALGLFGYDLGKRFEHLPDNNRDEYSTPDLAVGIYGWSVIKDNVRQQFYLCYLDNYPHPSIQDIQQLAASELPSTSFSLSSQWQANMSQEQYTHKLSRILAYLNAGDCYQINLAQRFSAHYRGDEWGAYQDLRVANQAPFSAFLRFGNGAVMSISPERFLSVKDRKVQTKPIKGTRPRCDNDEDDQLQMSALLSSEKDRAENLMIVDLLRNDLSKHCQPGTVDVPDLFQLESFAAVHHLVSTVTGKLKNSSSPMDLLQGAFPGGSITGAPKIRAMEIIDELEPNKRNVYCGSIGYLGILGDMDTNICIRTLLCENDKDEPTIHCWAGGGIVLDSDAKEEYQESLDKVSKILPTLTQQSSLTKHG